jgi:ABC-type transport system substrate-binding protein
MHSPSVRWRITAVRVALGLVFVAGFALGSWGLAEVSPRSGERRAEGKPGKKKRPVEEEEDNEEARKPKRRSVESIDVEDVDEKKPARKPSPAPISDLGSAADNAHSVAVRNLFRELAVPYDLLTIRKYKSVKVEGEANSSGTFSVEPLAEYINPPKRRFSAKQSLEVVNKETGKRRRTLTVFPADVTRVQYYEQRALEVVKDFLDTRLDHFDPEHAKFLSRQDQLQAAAQALSAVVRFHESARDRGVRKGKGWEAVEKVLRQGLLGVQLERLGAMADAKQWDEAFALTRRLAQTYTDLKDHARIAKPLAELLKKALRDPTYTEDKVKEARQRLRLLEEQFPDSDVIKPITESLHTQARALFKRAQEMAKNKERTLDALALLKQAEESWPQMPGLRTFRMELDTSYQALRVGVRELPRLMSPARAVTDSEKRAVEMLFEGLVKLTPDRRGMMFHRPGLSIGRPRVIPLGREFRLPRAARWSDGRDLTLGDIRYTLTRLQKGEGIEPTASGRAPVWGDLLGQIKAEGDPYRIKLLLRQGYLDPLALMTFKIVPQRSRPDALSEPFAKDPISSGPFRYKGTFSEPAFSREYAAFVANTNYGARPGKFALPRIKEIRFVALPKTTNFVKELLGGGLDMALDLTADQAADLRGERGITVRLPGEGAPNRRIYFLAVNHRKPILGKAHLRVALARAINREGLLDAHFRGKLGRKVHRALNGPYPAKSWACNPDLKSRSTREADKGSLDPYDPDLARTKLRQSGAKDVRLKLDYPSGDPALAKAITQLCEEVSKTLGIKLEPVERDPYKLAESVRLGTYDDLAYWQYDFPDETFWLMPLLGTSSRAGGDNIFGYNGGLVGRIQSSTGLRHFAQVRRYAHAIHRDFLDREMPFIPLWQLDPLMAYRSGTSENKDYCKVEMVPFEPHLVFTDVEQWRVVRGAKK